MINILQTSIYIIKTFNNLKKAPNAENIRLYVHSVYERTINLMIDNQLVALQIEGSPLSPISIILSVDESGLGALDIKRGDNVTIDGEIIKIGNNEFSLSNISETFDTLLAGDYRPQLLADITISLIRNSNRCGFSSLVLSDKAPDDLSLSYAKNKLDEAEAICNLIKSNQANDKTAIHTKQEKLCDTLSNLIGVGTGLTPSGDDFITGILSTFAAFPDCFDSELVKCLRSEIYNKCDNTNEISRAFLDCALKGQYSKSVIDLYKSICSAGIISPEQVSQETLTRLLNSFCKIGHTSGIDTLTGIFWSMKHVSKIYNTYSG